MLVLKESFYFLLKNNIFNNQPSPLLLFQLEWWHSFPWNISNIRSVETTSLCLRKDRQTGVHCVPALWQWTSVNFPGVQFIFFPLRSQLIENDDIKCKHFLSHWDMSQDPLLFINENIPMGQICKIHRMLELDLRTELTGMFLFPSLIIIT